MLDLHLVRLPLGFRAAVPLCRIITCGTVVILTSCGGSNPPAATSTAQPATASSPAAEAHSPQALAAAAAAQDDAGQGPGQVAVEAIQPAVEARAEGNTAEGNTADGNTAEGNAATADAASGESTNAPKPLATAAAANPAPPPTAEQLAKWNIRAAAPLDLLACHDWEPIGFVTTMATTPAGDYFILGGTQLTLWKPTAAEPEHVFLDLTTEPKRFITALAVAADGTWFCAGDSAGQLYVWRLADRTQVVAQPLYTNDISQIAISPSGDEIATLSYEPEVTTWDTQQWKKKRSFALDTNGVERIEYLADQRLVAAGETTSVWNTSTGELAQQLSPGRFQFALAATPDRQQFAIGTEAGLQFLRATDLAPTQLISGDFRDSQLSFSSDQQRLAACAGRDIVIYDMAQPQVIQVLEATGPAVVGVAWMPTSRLLVSVTQLGRIRVWGDKSAAQLVQLQSLQKANADSPATLADVLTAVDLRTLPRLPGGQATLGSSTMVTYTAPSTVAEATAFYYYVLGQMGWQPLPAAPHTPNYMTFVRDGFNLFIALTLSQEQLQVSLMHLGNFDLRTLPKLDVGEIAMIYENGNSVSYTTTADLLTVETRLLRQMQQAGWTHFARLNAAQDEAPDVRDMEFYKGAIIVRVSVRKFPNTPDRYTVQVANSLALSSLPLPAGVSMVEADLVSGEPRLVATTSLPLAAAGEFYNAELKAQGWLPRARGTTSQKETSWLNFIQGQRDLTIALSATKEGRTLIRVGEGLENLSWQLKQPEAIAENPATAGDSPSVGIEAADFPLLLGAKSLEFNADRQELRFKIKPAELLEIADHYVAELAKLGWQPTREGIKSADYVFLTFGKNKNDNDKAEINLRANILEQEASVGVEGDGLLWNKPLPVAPGLVSYASWLRTHRHPASLDLLEAYETEMRQVLTAAQSKQNLP